MSDPNLGSEPIVPVATRLAAKRAFVRTMFQGYEAVLAVGISANVVVGIVRGEVDVVLLAVTAAVAIVSPLLAGLRSWLSITRNGIPAEYEDVALVKQAVVTDAHAQSKVERAVERVVSQT